MSSVRIAHISDTHLGYRTGGRTDPENGRNQRTVDVDLAFTRMIDDVLEQKVDGVIHAGDVFHHARPTWQSLRHFIRQMRRLEQAGIPTLVIGGNHDTPRIRTGGSAYSVLELALPDITFVCDYEALDPSTFAHLDMQVQAVPHGALTNLDPVLATPPVAGKRNVRVMHGVAPGILPDGIQAEPGEENLPANLLLPDGMDYIALGHIHETQQANLAAWYAGSTERFGWGDQKASPGYLLVEFGEPGTLAVPEHRPIDSRPMLRLPAVSASGLSAREIADGILIDLEALNRPDAMTRLDLREADRPTRREVQSLLRRESLQFVWSFDLTPERSVFIPEGVAQPIDEAALDLHSLFAEFVAYRAPTYTNKDFATQFLEKGHAALTEAMLEEEAPNPEDDAVS